MTLEQIESLYAEFCNKCTGRFSNKCEDTACLIPKFIILLQKEWQLQTLRDLGGTTNYYDVKR